MNSIGPERSQEVFRRLLADTGANEAAEEELLGTLAGLIADRQRFLLFLGYKLAEEVASELGLADITGSDEETLTESKRLMGYAAASGVALRAKRTTEPDHIEQAKAEILDSLPPSHAHLVARMTGAMIIRGIEFHETELEQETPKAEAWKAEFQQLYSVEPQPE